MVMLKPKEDHYSKKGRFGIQSSNTLRRDSFCFRKEPNTNIKHEDGLILIKCPWRRTYEIVHIGFDPPFNSTEVAFNYHRWRNERIEKRLLETSQQTPLSNTNEKRKKFSKRAQKRVFQQIESCKRCIQLRHLTDGDNVVRVNLDVTKKDIHQQRKSEKHPIEKLRQRKKRGKLAGRKTTKMILEDQFITVYHKQFKK